MNLLITGSRKIEGKERFYVARIGIILSSIDKNKDKIIVGDAPGVDTLVVHRCYFEKINCDCYGAYGKNRIKVYSDSPNIQFLTTKGSYPKRDAIMVGVADYCTALWNGSSKGTKLTYDMAVKKGLPSLMIYI